MRAGALLVAAVAVLWLGLPAALSAVEELAGYRMGQYHSAVPATLVGATVVEDAAAYALWQGKEAAFIDVLPRPPKPANLPEGTVWRDKPRTSIKGAIWLANVGFGRLSEVDERYYRNGLVQATGGDLDQPLVIFCRADCWMSWNAAKRALSFGYRAVFWYPEGTDGWTANAWPTEKLRPLVLQ